MSGLFRATAPLLRALPPEFAHRATVAALRTGLVPRPATVDDPVLHVPFRGLTFPNPIGLAAGFDKNAEVPDAMLAQGFGFVEVGSITPRPQAGNPKPRLFRLPEDRAVINRLGFNNQGMAAVETRLRARQRRGIVGVNLGANKDSEDRIGDYVAGLKALGPYADYVTVNVSSPNTPGLRGLQNKAELEELLGRLEDARTAAGLAIPIALKIAPDLTEPELADIAAVVVAHGTEGLIVSNTTIARPPTLRGRHRDQSGGLSGAPLFSPSTETLRRMYQLTGGRITLVGVGGIGSGADAYAKIRAGASLVQLYTALTYQGPGLIAQIARDLAALLKRDGLDGVRAAVGADAGA